MYFIGVAGIFSSLFLQTSMFKKIFLSYISAAKVNFHMKKKITEDRKAR